VNAMTSLAERLSKMGAVEEDVLVSQQIEY
jgi:hypothetical protein